MDMGIRFLESQVGIFIMVPHSKDSLMDVV